MKSRLLVVASLSSIVLLAAACVEDPESDVSITSVACTTDLLGLEVRGSASGKAGQRLSLVKTGDGGLLTIVDVNCADWENDNDTPGVAECVRSQTSTSTAQWRVTYQTTSSQAMSASVIILDAQLKKNSNVIVSAQAGHQITMDPAVPTCLVE